MDDINNMEAVTSYQNKIEGIQATPILPAKRVRRIAHESQTGYISKSRTEHITQALTKLVATARLPYHFISSDAFKDFMNVLEPKYKVPSSETIVNRLRFAEAEIKTKIENNLAATEFVSLDTDCWTSRCQDGYINVNAHYIDKDWRLQVVTLCIEELDERHTAQNLADSLYNVAAQFSIEGKILSITNDNAANIVAAVKFMENIQYDVTCAAHKIYILQFKRLSKKEYRKFYGKPVKLLLIFGTPLLRQKAYKKSKSSSA